jgi:succinyl-CoA synthetase alpha subunit
MPHLRLHNASYIQVYGAFAEHQVRKRIRATTLAAVLTQNIPKLDVASFL